MLSTSNTYRQSKRWAAALLLSVAAVGAFAGAKEDIQADMKAGRWSQADQRLEAVIAKHPENALAHYWRAQVKFKLGQIEAAQAEVRKARELDPSESFAHDKATLRHIMDAQPASLATAPAVQATPPAPAPRP